MVNTFVAKLIQLLHIILVIGLVLSIFINSFPYKHLALIFLIFLLLHYITNNNVCMLTELEYYFLGEKYQEGFLHRLIKPVLTTPEKYNVNMTKFISAIKQTEDFKNTPLSWMATDSMITDGFNKDPRVQAAGVRLDEKGVMHFTKGMTPEAKDLLFNI